MFGLVDAEDLDRFSDDQGVLIILDGAMGSMLSLGAAMLSLLNVI